MKVSWLKIPLSMKIMAGMLLGILYGLIAINTGIIEFTSDWVSPFGDIFIRLLKLLAIPLILVSLIKGISDIKDTASLSRMGLRTIVLYVFTTIIAISIGLTVAYTIKPGNFFPKEKQQVLYEKYSDEVAQNTSLVIEAGDTSPIQFLVDVVPENIFKSSTDNTMMLQVIFFAILFGVAIISLPRDKTEPVRKLFDSLNEIVLRIIELIMKFAPFGVFALLASVITDIAGDNPSDSASLFGALAMYGLSVVIGLMGMIMIIYPLFASSLGRIKYSKFIKGVFPAQLLAFSTSSSAATLPVTKKCVEENLDVEDEVSSFVLPIGATINMDGTSLYQAVAAIFIAQVFGIDLSFADMLTIILTATLASIGSAAVPGTGMIMLIIVLASVNIPPEGLALIFAVDRPLDMLRTSVNVTGDSLISVIINRFMQRKTKII